MINLRKLIGITCLAASFAAGLLGSSAASAWEFLYMEHTLETAQLTNISSISVTGDGEIELEHDCDRCPRELTINSETQLTTPFGSGRSISELPQWRGHYAMIHYSTTNPTALRITVYSQTEFNDEDYQFEGESEL